MVFWATKVHIIEGKIKILKKNGSFKNKNIQCPVENKKFNDRVKVILSRKEIEEGQKLEYVNVKINDINIKLLLDTDSNISIIDV